MRRACRRTVVTQARRGNDVQQAVEAAPQKVQEASRGPLGNLPLVAVTVAMVWGLLQTAGVWRSVTSKNKREEAVSGKARIIESITDSRIADTFKRVDVSGDGRVDLRELTEALYKLNPNAPLSAARDSALDIFLLFDKDRNDRTLNREEFGQFLETWCLQTGSKLDDIAGRIGEPRDIEAHENREDQRVEEEVTRAAEAPEDLSRVLERRKLETVFRLWADRRGDGNRVERKDLARSLSRLLDIVGGDGADRARGLITSPAGAAQHAGYNAHLDRTEFTDLVRRVSDVAGMKHAEVLDFLIMIPLYGEERKALPPGRTSEDHRASAINEMHEAKEQAQVYNRRKEAINILSEARKEAHEQIEARKKKEAAREREREDREAGRKGPGGPTSSGNGRSGGSSNFPGTTASEGGIQAAASDPSKGSSSARS
ncbi:hypothetical protein WJX81_001914 [Elliptochloris bilobata]|uniref:EF-hand domain-containing protein n=1 Tax=Elliptochloris bilobata TaxID=381761 RepID=A0AAW1QDT0_9CHLO